MAPTSGQQSQTITVSRSILGCVRSSFMYLEYCLFVVCPCYVNRLRKWGGGVIGCSCVHAKCEWCWVVINAHYSLHFVAWRSTEVSVSAHDMVVTRPNLEVGNKSNFVGSLPRARRSTKLFVFNYRPLLLKWGKVSKLVLLWGHAISRITFWLCSFSVTFDPPHH